MENLNKLKENLFNYVWDHYWYIFHENTSILSSTCRQLALGIGGILLINGNVIGLLSRIIITLLVFFFLADLSQYSYQSYSYHEQAKKYDKEIQNEKIKDVSKLTIDKKIGKITNRLFILKILILLLTALFFLIGIWSVD